VRATAPINRKPTKLTIMRVLPIGSKPRSVVAVYKPAEGRSAGWLAVPKSFDTLLSQFNVR
jgi:hypothetical protein